MTNIGGGTGDGVWSAAVNFDRAIDFSVGGRGKWQKIRVHVPTTQELWGMTKGVDVELAKGSHALWMSAPPQRGVALKSRMRKKKA